MQPFTTLTAVAAPLPINNVDTDMIIPAPFLKTIRRTGLGAHVFDRMRFEDGKEIAEFVLNRAPYRQAQILVSGDNFGCGSSREHAPWALLDFGIRCVIAESFADIFYNNCFKNGILPVVLPKAQVQALMTYLTQEDTPQVTVDLPAQTVHAGALEDMHFTVPEFRKQCLLNGWDDVGLTLQQVEKIDVFERVQQERCPWLYSAA